MVFKIILFNKKLCDCNVERIKRDDKIKCIVINQSITKSYTILVILNDDNESFIVVIIFC